VRRLCLALEVSERRGEAGVGQLVLDQEPQKGLSYNLCSAPVSYRGFLARQPVQEAPDLRLPLADVLSPTCSPRPQKPFRFAKQPHPASRKLPPAVPAMGTARGTSNTSGIALPRPKKVMLAFIHFLPRSSMLLARRLL
jgi:hypothetical protein